jgi:hypothetical protein
MTLEFFPPKLQEEEKNNEKLLKSLLSSLPPPQAHTRRQEIEQRSNTHAPNPSKTSKSTLEKKSKAVDDVAASSVTTSCRKRKPQARERAAKRVKTPSTPANGQVLYSTAIPLLFFFHVFSSI